MIAPGMDAIAKYLGDTLSPLMITWARFAFQALVMSMALMVIGGSDSQERGGKRSGHFKTNRLSIHLLRGVLLATATLCFFWALQQLPLADCIAIFFVQPIILTLLSSVFLGETIGWHRRIAVVTGFLGAMFIIRPGTASFSIYYFLPLIAAVFYACYLAVTRAYASEDTPAIQQMASGVGGALFLSLLIAIAELLPQANTDTLAPEWGWNSTEPAQWGWLFAIGVIAAVAHMLVVMGMSRTPASVLAPFGYSEILAATALGWWIFGDWPSFWTWVGVAIIFGSGVYVAWRETRQSAML